MALRLNISWDRELLISDQLLTLLRVMVLIAHLFLSFNIEPSNLQGTIPIGKNVKQIKIYPREAFTKSVPASRALRSVMRLDHV